MTLYERSKELGLKETLEQIERELITQAIATTPDYASAAKMLKMARTTFVMRRKALGLYLEWTTTKKTAKNPHLTSKFGGNE